MADSRFDQVEILNGVRMALQRLEPTLKLQEPKGRFFEYHKVCSGVKCQVFFNNRDGIRWIELGWVLDSASKESNRGRGEGLRTQLLPEINNHVVYHRPGSSTGNNEHFFVALPLLDPLPTGFYETAASIAVWLRDRVDPRSLT